MTTGTLEIPQCLGFVNNQLTYQSTSWQQMMETNVSRIGNDLKRVIDDLNVIVFSLKKTQEVIKPFEELIQKVKGMESSLHAAHCILKTYPSIYITVIDFKELQSTWEAKLTTLDTALRKEITSHEMRINGLDDIVSMPGGLYANYLANQSDELFGDPATRGRGEGGKKKKENQGNQAPSQDKDPMRVD